VSGGAVVSGAARSTVTRGGSAWKPPQAVNAPAMASEAIPAARVRRLFMDTSRVTGRAIEKGGFLVGHTPHVLERRRGPGGPKPTRVPLTAVAPAEEAHPTACGMSRPGVCIYGVIRIVRLPAPHDARRP